MPNRDVEETLVFQKLAREIIQSCDLPDISIGSYSPKIMALIFAESATAMSPQEVVRYYPAMTGALKLVDNNLDEFDWRSLALAVDTLRGRALEIPGM